MNSTTLNRIKFQRCPRCKSQNLKGQTGNEESTIHYGRLVCGDCGQFIKWLRDPSVSLNHMSRQQNIDLMLANHELNQWERSFLQNIYARRTLSPKQLSTYQRIYQKITPKHRGSGRGERAIVESN
ncbi:MAG: hypothetical protein HC836_38000 [Richelia sp. RM2_1_2]|nr:hypothetical protein [Richelia sp. RM2_1_2]